MSIIIYPPTLDWAWMKQRPQHLMSEFARQGHTIYYCNLTQSEQEIEEIEPRLYLVHHHQKWLEKHFPFIINKSNTDVGIWCTLPMQAASIERQYQSDWVIYDCVDEVPQWQPFERQMVAISAAIVCTSERLYRRLRLTYPDKITHLIRNAYDLKMNVHHQAAPLPQTPSLQQIGYVGAWAPWLDEALIRKLAAIDQVELVLIGPEFERKYIDLHHRRSNIHFMGIKRHDELANLMRQFAVGIIPFHLTTITLATNPVKAYEYLASGMPVVTTNLPECRLMKPHVDVAQSHEAFVQMVKHRLQQPGDRDGRRQFALENTWQQRGEQAAQLLRAIRSKRELFLP
ncbi:glycosyltransferase [Paenibacillus sp. KN14-4R]|uniref:glycosyltransferase n=1 Tax=Paenibacillus sp. KN14-4R TaxID=3445773 RepID=UPI003FA193AC